MPISFENLAGYAGLNKIWEALPEARLVGGCVRDLLIGRDVNDIDLASPYTPEDNIKKLQEKGIKTIPTGLDHGTITAVIDRRPYEITTLRRDVETDGRHAVVAWTDNWQEDAQRRDFTMNALSLDQQGILYDYFGGEADLKKGRVRFVGEATKRIEEDALRSLRFFRFQARYGQGEADQDACKAIKQNHALVRNLSIERVASELLKILEGPEVGSIIALMQQTEILSEILPHPDPENLKRLLACQDPPKALPRLFALNPDPSIGRHLKLSRMQQCALKAYANNEPILLPGGSDDELRRLKVAQELSLLIDRSWLWQAKELGKPSKEWSHFRQRLSLLPQPEFLLTGRDGMELGLPPGPNLGIWLKKTQNWWLEQGCRPDKEACLAWLKEQVSSDS
ncbi:CCA tRNA nucleotidyltransferase [Aristophania vespae]|uniref:CCA tRNA nucleotidyltransferase n=1 Tax=Aristophania vespae TaxID=2697033 RepID=A0A6P1NH61_9PROT|nr:CCA tRNA nucleotidyltransferase [Aristophania vespae]QHI95870.1 CCA tRNA nucleotidyltransferase [Aristophania vespae]